MDRPPSTPTRRLPWSDVFFLIVALTLLAAIGTGLAWTLLGDRDNAAVARPSVIIPTSPPASPASPSPTSSGESSCQPVQTVAPFDAEPGDRAHAEVPLSRYPSVPPTSGPHSAATLAAGFYPQPPPVGQVIHSLEHGAVVIWFDPSVAESEALAQIRQVMGPSGPGQNIHVIIAPYDYPAEGKVGKLPSGVTMAIAAWHRLQYCTRIDADALRFAVDFVVMLRCHPGCNGAAYKGDAPEAGAAI